MKSYDTEELKVIIDKEDLEGFFIFKGVDLQLQVDIEEISRKNAQGEVSYSKQLLFVLNYTKEIHGMKINGIEYLGNVPSEEDFKKFPLPLVARIFNRFVEEYMAKMVSTIEADATKKK